MENEGEWCMVVETDLGMAVHPYPSAEYARQALKQFAHSLNDGYVYVTASEVHGAVETVYRSDAVRRAFIARRKRDD